MKAYEEWQLRRADPLPLFVSNPDQVGLLAEAAGL